MKNILLFTFHISVYISAWKYTGPLLLSLLHYDFLSKIFIESPFNFYYNFIFLHKSPLERILLWNLWMSLFSPWFCWPSPKSGTKRFAGKRASSSDKVSRRTSCSYTSVIHADMKMSMLISRKFSAQLLIDRLMN